MLAKLGTVLPIAVFGPQTEEAIWDDSALDLQGKRVPVSRTATGTEPYQGKPDVHFRRCGRRDLSGSRAVRP